MPLVKILMSTFQYVLGRLILYFGYVGNVHVAFDLVELCYGMFFVELLN